MAKVSPLLGYNTNVRHKGRLYHIQTEDSGISHPHIITHLFADGGRIVSSKKTGYAPLVGTDEYPAAVKKMMQEQHKGMFIALRDGVFDAELGVTAAGDVTAPGSIPAADVSTSSAALAAPVDFDALERAAAAKQAESEERSSVEITIEVEEEAEAPRAEKRPSRPSTGRYAHARPAGPRRRPTPAPASDSIFGKELVSEKSLDEVILSYLAEDLDEK